MKRKINRRRQRLIDIYYLLKNKERNVVLGRLPEVEDACISCGRQLKRGEIRFCRKCDLALMIEGQEDHLRSLEQHPDFRDNINEADAEFREKYLKARSELENLKFNKM